MFYTTVKNRNENHDLAGCNNVHNEGSINIITTQWIDSIHKVIKYDIFLAEEMIIESIIFNRNATKSLKYEELSTLSAVLKIKINN